MENPRCFPWPRLNHRRGPHQALQRRGPVPRRAFAQMRRRNGDGGALAKDVAVLADPGMGFL